MAAEWIWLARWKGTSPKALLNPADFPDFASVKARWAEVEGDLMEFVNQMSQDALEQVINYTNTRGETWRYPLRQLMQHLVNHSSYHRGQVTTMLRQPGAEESTNRLATIFRCRC